MHLLLLIPPEDHFLQVGTPCQRRYNGSFIPHDQLNYVDDRRSCNERDRPTTPSVKS